VLQVAQTISVIISLAERGDEQDVVTLSTLHAAKGLEWPHVVLAGVNEGLLPFAQRGRRDDARAAGRGAPADVRGHHARAQHAGGEHAAPAQEAGRDTVAGVPSRFIAEMKLDEVTAKEDPRERLKKLRAELAARGPRRRRRGGRMNAGLPGCRGAALVAALLAIVSAPWALGQPWMNFVFKPLTTVLIIALAWPRGRDTPVLRRWVLVGLVLSLGGDVALLWPQQGFLPGLVSFLLAHLAYLAAAFTRVSGWPPVAGPSRLRRRGGVVLARCGPAFRRRCACRSSPTCCAWPRWRRRRRCCGAQRAARRGRRRLALGGALFLASDALLASNRFAQPLPLASLWILATYWAAQWARCESALPLHPFKEPREAARDLQLLGVAPHADDLAAAEVAA
jgi:uncharacterized membrane protein YhhN